MAVQVRFCYHIRFFKKQNKQMIPKAKLFEFLELQGLGKCRKEIVAFITGSDGGYVSVSGQE